MRALAAVTVVLALSAWAKPGKGAKVKAAPPVPVAAPAAAAAAAPTGKKGRGGGGLKLDALGEVSSATASAVFVNRGEADGVKVGQTLNFTRGGKPTGSCTVSAVAQHFARCDSGGLRVGDKFAMGRVAAPVPLGPAPLPSDAEMKRRGAMVDDSSWSLRDFDGASSSGSGSTYVDLAFSHTTFTGRTNGPYGVQRLDILVPDVEIWKGLRVSADLTGLNFSARPEGFTSTQYPQTPVLLVRQLELGFRRADVPFSAALGRTWLRSGTGLLAIDGAQVGWRFGEGFELGAWGGLLPEAARLTIQPSQWSAGAFGRIRFSSGTGANATLMQVGVRAGWSQRDLLGGRFEAGIAANLWAGQTFDANAMVELGYGASQAVAGIDAARVDFGVRPSERVRVNGAFRYRGLPLTSLAELGTVSPGQRAMHADLGAVYAVTPGLWVAVNGGFAGDINSQLFQGRVGPELSMPRLFDLPLNFGLGYVEEIGWVRGRNAYAQLQVIPAGWLRFTTRFNWFNQQASQPNPGLASNEVGTSVALEVTPVRFIRGRVAFVGRLPVGGGVVPGEAVALQASTGMATPSLQVPIGSLQFQLAGGF